MKSFYNKMWSIIIRFIKWFFLGETAHAYNTMQLVPLKVKIGLRKNGNADHPDWTKLSLIEVDKDTRKYAPFSWMYDSCGHTKIRDEGNLWDSPRDMQWGVFLSTREFANEALTTFPDTISELTEAEFEDFYNNKHKEGVEEYLYDNKALESLRLERELKLAVAQSVTSVDARIAAALNPDSVTKGRKRNTNRLWSQFKAENKITIALQ